ncbi:MAG: hypothetical protein ACPG21_11260 [Crocinitomicaceae bacterium]
MNFIQLTAHNLTKFVALFALLLGWQMNACADFSIEGHYQGKKLYVQSPLDEDGFGFCIKKVTVNGEIIPFDTYSSAFQIDLSEYNIEIGQEVIIVFEHDAGCKPKIINPEVLRPKSTFVLEDISCTPEGVLSWSTTNESGKLNYLIEQYKWNKWVVIGEVTGLGTPELHNYTFNVLPHSGENKVRIAQIDNTSKKRVTESVTFSPSLPSPKINILKDEKLIEFVAENKRVKTKYEIFDAYGNIVKKGFNEEVSFANLKPGVYHVNYDNKNDRLVVR